MMCRKSIKKIPKRRNQWR